MAHSRLIFSHKILLLYQFFPDVAYLRCLACDSLRILRISVAPHPILFGYCVSALPRIRFSLDTAYLRCAASGSLWILRICVSPHWILFGYVVSAFVCM